MDEVVSNVQTFMETLQNASGMEVADWDTETLQRAIDWAKYSQEVHNKIMDKPARVQKMNRALYLISHLPGAAVSQSAVTFDSLSQSVRLLLQALLQNPHLTPALYSEVIRQYTLLDSDAAADAEKSLIQDIGQFAKAAAMREHLLVMRAHLSQSMKEELGVQGKSVERVAMETDASLLADHLVHHMADGQPSQRTTEYLQQLLICIAERPGGLDTIENVLPQLGLLEAGSQKESVISRQCEQLISCWLQDNRGRYSHHREKPG